MSRQQLHIDWTTCDGRGSCIELLPELLRRDPWGYPLVVAGTRDAEVPEPLTDHARRAVSTCPKLALRLVQSE
jgi:ferredoxin